MQPTAYYILTGTRRCGSSLLCDLLEWTRIAGAPQEFFSRWLLSYWLNRWQLPEDCPAEVFYATSLQRQTTPNGVHGVKLFYDHLFSVPFATLAANRGKPPEAALHVLYPHARYLHLSRRDLRGQALSYFRAIATDAWFLPSPGHMPRQPPPLEQAPPPLDLQQVMHCEEGILQEEQAWSQFYTRHAIVPLRIIYEDLIDNMHWQVARCLEWLGLDALCAYQIPPPRFQQQRDAVTEQWRQALTEYLPLRSNPYILETDNARIPFRSA